MIPTENKNTTQFKQRLLPNCLPQDFEIVAVNGGESTSQYHTPPTVAKFTGKRKKIKSCYFIATPRILTALYWPHYTDRVILTYHIYLLYWTILLNVLYWRYHIYRIILTALYFPYYIYLLYWPILPYYIGRSILTYYIDRIYWPYYIYLLCWPDHLYRVILTMSVKMFLNLGSDVQQRANYIDFDDKNRHHCPLDFTYWWCI